MIRSPLRVISDEISRLRGTPARYRLRSNVVDLHIWFKVNPKASAIPFQPGEFWPAIATPVELRHPREPDDGTISWYLYTTPDNINAVQSLRRRVIEKVAQQKDFPGVIWRDMRDDAVQATTLLLGSTPEGRFPHTRLFYLDAEDALEWGREFARQVKAWVEDFEQAPETLAMYMWRIHWSEYR